MSEPTTLPPAPLGVQIRRLRKRRGMTLKDIARRAGTSVPTMHRYEGGWERFSVGTLRKIANALDAELEIRLLPQGKTTQHGRTVVCVSNDELVKALSTLFWDRPLDTDKLETYPKWVIRRVLTEGNLEQARLIVDHFGLEAVQRAIRGRSINERTRAFWLAYLEEST